MIDPRVACEFCFSAHHLEQATYLVPQYGEEANRPARWVLSCTAHYYAWQDGVDTISKLPAFELPEDAAHPYYIRKRPQFP